MMQENITTLVLVMRRELTLSKDWFSSDFVTETIFNRKCLDLIWYPEIIFALFDSCKINTFVLNETLLFLNS